MEEAGEERRRGRGREWGRGGEASASNEEVGCFPLIFGLQNENDVSQKERKKGGDPGAKSGE